MAFKGTASKSSTGASMSKYDVEVEARLTKLEAAVAALEASGGGSGGSDARVEQVVAKLKAEQPGKWKDL